MLQASYGFETRERAQRNCSHVDSQIPLLNFDDEMGTQALSASFLAAS